MPIEVSTLRSPESDISKMKGYHAVKPQVIVMSYMLGGKRGGVCPYLSKFWIGRIHIVIMAGDDEGAKLRVFESKSTKRWNILRSARGVSRASLALLDAN